MRRRFWSDTGNSSKRVKFGYLCLNQLTVCSICVSLFDTRNTRFTFFWVKKRSKVAFVATTSNKSSTGVSETKNNNWRMTKRPKEVSKKVINCRILAFNRTDRKSLQYAYHCFITFFWRKYRWIFSSNASTEIQEIKGFRPLNIWCLQIKVSNNDDFIRLFRRETRSVREVKGHFSITSILIRLSWHYIEYILFEIIVFSETVEIECSYYFSVFLRTTHLLRSYPEFDAKL